MYNTGRIIPWFKTVLYGMYKMFLYHWYKIKFLGYVNRNFFNLLSYIKSNLSLQNNIYDYEDDNENILKL